MYYVMWYLIWYMIWYTTTGSVKWRSVFRLKLFGSKYKLCQSIWICSYVFKIQTVLCEWAHFCKFLLICQEFPEFAIFIKIGLQIDKEELG